MADSRAVPGPYRAVPAGPHGGYPRGVSGVHTAGAVSRYAAAMSCVCVAEGEPPSSYAIADLVEGRRGAIGRTIFLTASRVPWIFTGLALSGVRGQQLVVGSLVTSVALTTWITLFYLTGGRGEVELPQARPLPTAAASRRARRRLRVGLERSDASRPDRKTRSAKRSRH